MVYRFCKIDKTRFGEIPNVTDKLYYTNSYHVNVREEIDAFSKLKFEAPFHKISSGGRSNNLNAATLKSRELYVKTGVFFRC